MADNRRHSGDSTLDSFEVINMMDAQEEVDGGSSCNPICKHCQKKYVQKDIIAWCEAECKSGFCLKCGQEMISLVAKKLGSYASLHEMKVYKVKETPATVSSIIEKPQPAEGPSKQNTVCKLCKLKYEKDCDIITWFKIVCEEGYCCLDCGQSKCFFLWKVVKDSAPTLELQMYEETVSDFAIKREVFKVQEKFASLFSSVEKAQPEVGPSNQIICPCCSCVLTCTNCKGGNVSCQSTCSCCIGNKSKNTETSAVKQSGDEIKLKASKSDFDIVKSEHPEARVPQSRRCFYCDCKDQRQYCAKCFHIVFTCPGSCRCCDTYRREKEEDTEKVRKG